MRRHGLMLAVLGLAALMALGALPAAEASPMRPLSKAFKRTGAAVRRKAVAASSKRRQLAAERVEGEGAEGEGAEGVEEQEVMTEMGPVGGRRALQRRHRRRALQQQRQELDEEQEEGGDAGADGPKPEPMKISMDFQILDPRDGADFTTQGTRLEGAGQGSHSIFAGKESVLLAVAAAVGAAVLVAGAVLLRRAQLRRQAVEQEEEAARAYLQQGAESTRGRKRPQGLGPLGAASAAGGESGPLSSRLASERSGAGKGKGGGKIVVREESRGALESTRGGAGASGTGPGASPASTRGEFFNLQDIDLQQSPGRGKGALLAVSSPRK
jgi:hypothetical protein